MPIPKPKKNGELPPGEHIASLAEVEERFGRASAQRQQLMAGLKAAASNLATAGVKRIWIDGSFITTKEHPNDIDGCWAWQPGVDLEKLDPVFLARDRTPMKQKYGLDFFLAHLIEAGSRAPFPEFFQTNRDGERKGIIVIELGGHHDD